MKGLLIKDLKLMMEQKIFLIIILLIGVIPAVAGGGADIGFGYITGISGILAVTTINYDSYDNGFSFLFTLPVSRKGYVKEKFVLAILSSFVVMAVMNGLVWIVMSAGMSEKNSFIEFMGTTCDYYMGSLVMIAVMLPVFLEFGAEKSKYIILIGAGIIMVVSMIMSMNILEDASLLDAKPMMKWFGSVEINRVITFIVCLALLAGSYVLSVMAMESKEF